MRLLRACVSWAGTAAEGAAGWRLAPHWEEHARDAAQRYYAGTQALQPADVAAQALHIAELPPHVNITRLEVTPLCQQWSPFTILRE